MLIYVIYQIQERQKSRLYIQNQGKIFTRHCHTDILSFSGLTIFIRSQIALFKLNSNFH